MDQATEQAQAPSAYKRAGVDIEAGHRAVELMKGAVRRTHGPAVLGGLGGFGGLFRPDFTGVQEPVLVASTDSVGTKTTVAARFGRYAGLGHDIVNHCANDILVQGARPLFFLDYIAMGRLVPEHAAAFVTGAAEACQALGAALLGGETAELPGVYVEGELDLVGTIVGLVDRPKLIDGSGIRVGDAVIGLPSSGLHTNGFSLARAALHDLNWDEARADLDGATIADALLAPHRAYGPAFDALTGAGVEVRGMAHITGGGLIDNPPRVFPAGLGMEITEGSWPVLPIFELIVREGRVSSHDAYHALNMGLGFLFIVPGEQAPQAQVALTAAGEAPYLIGRMAPGAGVAFMGGRAGAE